MEDNIKVVRKMLNDHCEELLNEGTYPIDFTGYVALVDVIKDLTLAANGYLSYVDVVHGNDLHELACKIANIMLGKE